MAKKVAPFERTESCAFWKDSRYFYWQTNLKKGCQWPGPRHIPAIVDHDGHAITKTLRYKTFSVKFHIICSLFTHQVKTRIISFPQSLHLKWVQVPHHHFHISHVRYPNWQFWLTNGRGSQRLFRSIFIWKRGNLLLKNHIYTSAYKDKCSKCRDAWI